jgi:hypothetical protein
MSSLVLDTDWAHDILETILSTKQGHHAFIDWKIEIENLNSILASLAPTLTLTKVQLQVQLLSNLNPDLRCSLRHEPVKATNLAAWGFEVRDRDDRLCADEERMQKVVDTSSAAHAVCHSEKKDLLLRLSDLPVAGSSSTTAKTKKPVRACLPPLIEAERALIKEHAGCMQCRRLNVRHGWDTCPMNDTNSWPDPTTYVTLKAPMGLHVATITAPAMNKGEEKDNETDMYVPPPPNIPFTVNHLYATLNATGPHH